MWKSVLFPFVYPSYSYVYVLPFVHPSIYPSILFKHLSIHLIDISSQPTTLPCIHPLIQRAVQTKPIHPSIYLSIHPCKHLSSTILFISPANQPPIHWPTLSVSFPNPSSHPSHLSIHPSIHPSFHPSIHPSIHVCKHLSSTILLIYPANHPHIHLTSYPSPSAHPSIFRLIIPIMFSLFNPTTPAPSHIIYSGMTHVENHCRCFILTQLIVLSWKPHTIHQFVNNVRCCIRGELTV